MFTGLASFTQYTVTIVAVDTMDREGEINTITVTTNIAAPDNFRGTKNSRFNGQGGSFIHHHCDDKFGSS
jgi:hypothetical protein